MPYITNPCMKLNAPASRDTRRNSKIAKTKEYINYRVLPGTSLRFHLGIIA